MPTKIEWCDMVWNPVVGCTPASAGCDRCYAKRIFNRNLSFHDHKFENPTPYPARLDMPFHWKAPRRVFVNSMSDLFHPDVPFSFIEDVFSVMVGVSRHTFMVLTKRPARMLEFLDTYCLPGSIIDNIWFGVSVEDQHTVDERIPLLLQVPAAVRFVSVEPMLGPVNLNATGHDFLCHCDGCLDLLSSAPEMWEARRIDWVICGGESGPGARPLNPHWVRVLKDQCVISEVPFFFKGYGEWTTEFPQGLSLANRAQTYESGQSFYRIGKKLTGKKLDGREWNQFPEVK